MNDIKDEQVEEERSQACGNAEMTSPDCEKVAQATSPSHSCTEGASVLTKTQCPSVDWPPQINL